VFPAGTKTSKGATAPALAGAATFSARITSRVLLRSALVKIKPTFPGVRQILQATAFISKTVHTFDVRKKALIFGEVRDESLDCSSDLSF